MCARAVLWQRKAPRANTVRPYGKNACWTLPQGCLLSIAALAPSVRELAAKRTEGESLAIYPKLQNKIRFSPPPAGAGAPSQRGPFGARVGADAISARAVLWQRQAPRANTVRPYGKTACWALPQGCLLPIAALAPSVRELAAKRTEGESLAIYPKLQNKIRFFPPPAGAGAPSQRGPFGSPLQHTQT